MEFHFAGHLHDVETPKSASWSVLSAGISLTRPMHCVDHAPSKLSSASMENSHLRTSMQLAANVHVLHSANVLVVSFGPARLDELFLTIFARVTFVLSFNNF